MMKLPLLYIILTFSPIITQAQKNMRSIEELINKEDPGWTLVKEWIDSARNKVEILPVDEAKAKDALYKLQITTRSPMGAIVYMTGGILVDDSWIRILGSGSEKLNRTLPDWNKGKAFTEFGVGAPFLLIADDAIGGFYLLNGGALGDDLGKVYYFSPDNLEYEPMDMTYTEFLLFCFGNDLDKYYEGYRWTDWRKEVSVLPGDKVFNFYPFLSSAEGKDINKNSRKIVPVEEQFDLNLQMREQPGQ
jgi:hypothetical protein